MQRSRLTEETLTSRILQLERQMARFREEERRCSVSSPLYPAEAMSNFEVHTRTDRTASTSPKVVEGLSANSVEQTYEDRSTSRSGRAGSHRPYLTGQTADNQSHQAALFLEDMAMDRMENVERDTSLFRPGMAYDPSDGLVAIA